MSKTTKTEQQWRASLSPDAFAVCRQQGTEAPFSGRYYNLKDDGIYRCVCCEAELFSSEHKYDSGSGWPSFWQGVDAGRLLLRSDVSHGMTRTEVVCAACEGHLGHVFDDGPRPTNQRYCINSVSLKFEPKV